MDHKENGGDIAVHNFFSNELFNYQDYQLEGYYYIKEKNSVDCRYCMNEVTVLRLFFNAIGREEETPREERTCSSCGQEKKWANVRFSA